MSRRRRHRHRAGIWLAAILLGASWQIAIIPLRWLAMIVSLGVCIAGPVLVRGTLHAVPSMAVPRRMRMAQRKDQPRPPIPAWIRKTTYAADRNRCVYCKRGPRQGVPIQWDHIIPWSFGGLTTLWNGAALCQRENLVKSNYWKSDTGQVYYRPWRNAADKTLAGAILRAELRARLSPLRWIRAGRVWWTA